MLAIICQASQLRSESSTRKCQWLETLEWKVLALHKGLGFELFLGCVTLSRSFALSELPSLSPTSETGKQKQEGGCYGERVVAKVNPQHVVCPRCIVKVGCPPVGSICGHFRNTFFLHTIFCLVLVTMLVKHDRALPPF